MTLSVSSHGVFAQNVQMQCRPLVANDFIGQDEVIVSNQVCHVVHAASVSAAPTPSAVSTNVAPAPAAALPPAVPAQPQERSSGKVTVVLYRPSRFIDASRKATIYVDNRPLCILTNNSNFKFELPAGMHSLGTLFNRQTTGETALPGSQFNFVVGQTYYFTLNSHWLIFAVSAEQGELESGRTKPLKESNISVQPSGNELN